MSTMRMMYDNLFDSATVTASSAATGFPVSNTQHPWRRRQWRSTGVAAEWVKWDLGSAQAVSCIIIDYHNLQLTATVALEVNSEDAWTPPDGSSIVTVTATKIIIFLDPALTYQWWRLTMADVGNPDGYLRIGRPYGGPHIEPSRNYLYGPDWQPIDPSPRAKSLGGDLSSSERPMFAKKAYSFAGLTDTDAGNILALNEAVGERKPFYICDDPATGATATRHVLLPRPIQRDKRRYNYWNVSMEVEEAP